MSIKAALATYLGSEETITAIVGTSPKRIYPVKLPQNVARPALTYRRLPKPGAHEHQLSGSAGVDMPRIRISAICDEYKDADVLAEAVRQVMQGFSGSWGNTSVGSVILDDESDDFEYLDDGSDAGVFICNLDYVVIYDEPIPTL